MWPTTQLHYDILSHGHSSLIMPTPQDQLLTPYTITIFSFLYPNGPPNLQSASDRKHALFGETAVTPDLPCIKYIMMPVLFVFNLSMGGGVTKSHA